MATLRDLARINHRGNLMQEQDAELLASLQEFDPNASYIATDSNDGWNWRLNFDPSKLPQNKVNNERGVFGTVPVYEQGGEYYDSSRFRDDENYGQITESANFKGDSNWLDQYGPMLAAALISIGAPAIGGALAGAGIGGAAGLTAGVTGSGVMAGSAPSTWLTQLAARAPNLGRAAASGNMDSVGSALLNAGGQALGMPAWSRTALTTLGSLARRKP